MCPGFSPIQQILRHVVVLRQAMCNDVLLILYHANMSVYCIPPYIPLLYSKTAVYRGIHFFLFLLLNIDFGYSLEPPH